MYNTWVLHDIGADEGSSKGICNRATGLRERKDTRGGKYKRERVEGRQYQGGNIERKGEEQLHSNPIIVILSGGGGRQSSQGTKKTRRRRETQRRRKEPKIPEADNISTHCKKTKIPRRDRIKTD